MANKDLIREIVAKACCDALQQRSQELSEEVAQRACDELARSGWELASQPAPPEAPRERTKELLCGALLISGSKSQTETLETLLGAVSAITPSCGLLILRGTKASGWNCKGLATTETFKGTTLDCAQGVGATVVNSCTAAVAQASELDPVFVGALGLENSTQILLVPILLKGRVVALLIALLRQSDDLAGVKLLVQITQLALELQALRKVVPQPPVEAYRSVAGPEAKPPEPTPAETTPDAVPVKPMVEQVYAAATAMEVSQVASPSAEPAYVATNAVNTLAAPPAPAGAIAVPAFQASPAPPQFGQPLPGEVHERARRFAKLLVEEIKLYNQAKLAEGRARCDLYSRLRDDIEKSRSAYQKRYGESVRDVDYFTQELLRILADNNRSVMGPGFPG